MLLGFKPSVIAASALHFAAFDLFPAHFPDFEAAVSSSFGLDPVIDLVSFFLPPEVFSGIR